MRLIRPPEAHDAGPRPRLFLAGAIDRGRAEAWQDRAAAGFSDLPGSVLNPRRADWDDSWGADLDDPRFAAQVTWELEGLDDADLIACWLPAASAAPVSLMEIGLHARRGRLAVGCQDGFHRIGNVRAICQRYAVPLLASLDDLIALTRHRLLEVA
jgi:hypothetical protein